VAEITEKISEYAILDLPWMGASTIIVKIGWLKGAREAIGCKAYIGPVLFFWQCAFAWLACIA
jgi:hypothetical protein